ncbi:hypothetical protein M408DRAFT_74719 [Serendipita vermifera MAFF 305830]|uniref:Uncharacterized protein n=1 Tax=Serendipita vermifera MAFF 305830 TaxID=933852 RepID=A0A0C3B0Z7_SERVB|nr:hypothetical protein M408DRAFT_74719 [Serendipita vermifera MAFF 305830]
MVAGQVIRKTAFQKWFAIEVRFCYVIMTGALGGASWYIYRLSTRPDIVWTRKNPEPFQTVKPNETTKMMSGTHRFDGKWVIHRHMHSLYTYCIPQLRWTRDRL